MIQREQKPILLGWNKFKCQAKIQILMLLLLCIWCEKDWIDEIQYFSIKLRRTKMTLISITCAEKRTHKLNLIWLLSVLSSGKDCEWGSKSILYDLLDSTGMYKYINLWVHGDFLAKVQALRKVTVTWMSAMNEYSYPSHLKHLRRLL